MPHYALGIMNSIIGTNYFPFMHDNLATFFPFTGRNRLPGMMAFVQKAADQAKNNFYNNNPALKARHFFSRLMPRYRRNWQFSNIFISPLAHQLMPQWDERARHVARRIVNDDAYAHRCMPPGRNPGGCNQRKPD